MKQSTDTFTTIKPKVESYTNIFDTKTRSTTTEVMLTNVEVFFTEFAKELAA